ncbi:MAG: copper amine oxidase N-terminal domain-containing protein, partial [Niameybacter sp.]
MRIHEKLITMLLATMVTWAMPEAILAKSMNHMSKVMTIGENTRLGIDTALESVPQLVIELKDGLTKGDMFYIHLDGAEWIEESLQGVQSVIESKRINPTQFEISVKQDIPEGKSMMIPILAKVVGEEATLRIDSNNTTLTEETLTFAHTSKEKGKVTALAPIKATEQGEMAKITVEEAYGGQFASGLAKGQSNKIRLSLDSTEFIWDITGGMATPKIEGIKAYSGISGNIEAFKLISPGVLEVTLPSNIKEVNTSQKGAFVIQGLGVKSKVKEPKPQRVTATVEGEWIDKGVLGALEIADFNVVIEPKESYHSLSGKYKEISFTLHESLPDSIQKNRGIDITFTGGITVPVSKDGNVAVYIEGKYYEFPPIEEEGRTIGFEMLGLEMPELSQKLDYTFKLDIEIGSEVEGKGKVIVEGRGLPKTLEADLIEVTQPVKAQIESFKVVEGKKEQVGGGITLTETQAGALEVGEKLFIRMDLEDMSLAKAPLVTVEKGDIGLGEAEVVEGGVALEILKKSTKPATISIKHFVVDVSGAVADGRYKVAIGGGAISQLSGTSMSIKEEGKTIDALIEEDFILVNMAPKNLRKITFKMGEEAYAVNGKYHHLDVPAHIEEGRTLVPIKYVAQALGISSDQVKWNKKTQEITLYGNKVIELEIGSNIMRVDGKKTYMATEVVLEKGRTMVPIGEISRALEVDTTWDDKT